MESFQKLVNNGLYLHTKRATAIILVYVQGQKIAALGLRVKRGSCYHGLSLNVNMDLTPFFAIDPCGYVGLEVTQTKNLGIDDTPQQMGEALLKRLQEKLA